MPKSLDEYAVGLRDARNLNALKQYPLPDGGGLACGTGDEPNTTIAIVAGKTGQSLIAVENDGGFEARETSPTPLTQAQINGIGLKAVKLCKKLVP